MIDLSKGDQIESEPITLSPPDIWNWDQFQISVQSKPVVQMGKWADALSLLTHKNSKKK